VAGRTLKQRGAVIIRLWWPTKSPRTNKSSRAAPTRSIELSFSPPAHPWVRYGALTSRSFCNTQCRRFVGLCARGSAHANGGSRNTAMAARGAAWASRRRWPRVPRSRVTRAATRTGAGHCFLFGLIATALIALAALVGGGLLAAHVFKRRIAGIMIGIHATLAVSGFVVLAAYVFAG